MSRSLTIVVGMVILFVLGGMAWIVASRDEKTVLQVGLRTTSFGRGVAEDVSVRKHGYYGIDFIRCGSCSIEKRKLGPLTLGGFNVLVLTDLSVVIPREEDQTTAASDETTAMELANRLGVTRELTGAQGVPFKFSGLRVEGLRIATLDAATNVCPRLVAASGEAARDGLHLRGCAIIRDGKTNAVDRAVLKVKPDLCLVWSAGELKL